MRHGRVLGEHRLECQRGGHAGHHDQQDDGGEVDRVYHADGKTLLRHDQCHLAASHHADTNLQGVAPVEAADLGSQAATHDLGDQCHNHKADAEQQDLRALNERNAVRKLVKAGYIKMVKHDGKGPHVEN